MHGFLVDQKTQHSIAVDCEQFAAGKGQPVSVAWLLGTRKPILTAISMHIKQTSSK